MNTDRRGSTDRQSPHAKARFFDDHDCASCASLGGSFDEYLVIGQALEILVAKVYGLVALRKEPLDNAS